MSAKRKYLVEVLKEYDAVRSKKAAVETTWFYAKIS